MVIIMCLQAAKFFFKNFAGAAYLPTHYHRGKKDFNLVCAICEEVQSQSVNYKVFDVFDLRPGSISDFPWGIGNRITQFLCVKKIDCFIWNWGISGKFPEKKIREITSEDIDDLDRISRQRADRTNLTVIL